jgi:MFS family permease
MTQTETAARWREVAATGHLPRFFILCLGVWLHAADSLLVATVMPASVAEIGGVVFINWASALYQLGSILAAAATSSVARRIGLRGTLTLAAGCYALGCALSALAPEIGTMLLGRVLQGLGGGGLIALVYVAVQALFPERFWPRLLVVVSTIWGASALCGPLIGGAFAEAGQWRWAFWAFAGQALALIAAARFLPGLEGDVANDRSRGAEPVPLALLVLGTIGIASAGVVATPFEQAGLGTAGLCALYAFAQADRRQDHRLLPKATLDRHHPVGNGLQMVFALSAATAPFGTYGPLLLGLLFGIGPMAAGYLVAIEAVAWSLASFAASGAAGAGQENRLIRVGAVLIAAGALGYVLAVPSGSVAGIVACLIAQGAGFGLSWPYIVKCIVAGAPEAERGAAAGAVSTMHLIGYAVGASASGIAANSAGLASGATPSTAHDAALWLFGAFAPLGLAGAAAAFRLTANGNPAGVIRRGAVPEDPVQTE